MKYNLTILDAFAEVLKVMNYTEQEDAEFTEYSPSATLSPSRLPRPSTGRCSNEGLKLGFFSYLPWLSFLIQITEVATRQIIIKGWSFKEKWIEVEGQRQNKHGVFIIKSV